MTLKITTDEGPETATLRLEGRVMGPWVNEFLQAWHSLENSLGSRKLLVDLRGVTQMNADAREVLSEIHEKTGAEFLADTPLVKYFAEQARRRNTKDGNEEE
jgi:hypothetical protein